MIFCYFLGRPVLVRVPDFQVHRHTKVIPVATNISFARRPLPLRSRYTNRYNPGNSRRVRNVPVPAVRRIGARNRRYTTTKLDEIDFCPEFEASDWRV